MKEIDFERYLEDMHAKQYQGLDDDMPENFSEWLEDLDIDTICKYANAFARDKVCEYIDDETRRLQND